VGGLFGSVHDRHEELLGELGVYRLSHLVLDVLAQAAGRTDCVQCVSERLHEIDLGNHVRLADDRFRGNVQIDVVVAHPTQLLDQSVRGEITAGTPAP
jgi:hypothetical protein